MPRTLSPAAYLLLISACLDAAPSARLAGLVYKTLRLFFCFVRYHLKRSFFATYASPWCFLLLENKAVRCFRVSCRGYATFPGYLHPRGCFDAGINPSATAAFSSTVVYLGFILLHTCVLLVACLAALCPTADKPVRDTRTERSGRSAHRESHD